MCISDRSLQFDAREIASTLDLGLSGRRTGRQESCCGTCDGDNGGTKKKHFSENTSLCANNEALEL